MTSIPCKLLHLAAWVRGMGGVETLLARHAKMDAANGFDAFQIALFDRNTTVEDERYAFQSFSWRSTPRMMRRVMTRALADRAGSVIAWHNAWGMPWFSDIDASIRRIICLQDGEAHFGPWLSKLNGSFDAVTCLSHAAARTIAGLLPDLPPERLAVLPLPIAQPDGVTDDRPLRREWIIGCAGRLVRSQKRWDRLVPFVSELRRMGVMFKLDVVSDGPLRQWLERQLGNDPSIHFLGWQGSSEYWRRIQSWAAAVFFSDHEGGPIVLLEAMAAGVVPIYPTIGGSLGDDYVPQIDPRCHYRAGDPRAAARAVRDVLSSPPAVLAEIRRRAQALAKPHQSSAYDLVFADLVKRVAAMPRISREPRGDRKARITDRLPLGLITRFLPWALWR